MQKKTFLIFLAALPFTLLACSLGPSSPPLISLLVDGTSVQGFQSSYCWDQLNGTICVDSMEPHFDSTLPLPADAPIRLELERPLPEALRLVLTDEIFGDDVFAEEVPPAALVEWLPAVAPGDYILNVEADWSQGSVTYWFSISIP